MITPTISILTEIRAGNLQIIIGGIPYSTKKKGCIHLMLMAAGRGHTLPGQPHTCTDHETEGKCIFYILPRCTDKC